MYVKRNISLGIIWKFAWKNLLFFIIYGCVVTWLFHYLEHKGINASIPFSPISVIGIAVAFYLGFKNNQSYDRFWEGRKIWGGIVNYSRTWANQVLSYMTLTHTQGKITEDELGKIQKKFIYRHMAWMNALRLQLRKPTSFSIDHSKKSSKHFKSETQEADWQNDVGIFLDPTEIETYKGKRNVATQLIRTQGKYLKKCMDNGIIEDFRHMDLMASLEEFYNLQGKAERIKKTPLPRQYSFFSGVFVWIFILLLPFGLIGEFNKMGHSLIWLTVPFFTLVAWVFITMEKIGDNSEDPFEGFINDVPMTALCRVIEIDLREMLGEEDIPPGIEAVNGILM